MTELQKGKVLKTLNKQIKHKGKIMTRKEWITEVIEEGYIPEFKENVNFVNRKVKDYYAMSNNEGEWYEVTKTEYDYAVYLLAQK